MDARIAERRALRRRFDIRCSRESPCLGVHENVQKHFIEYFVH